MAENRYFYAVGRRKTASAQVRLYPEGTGQITVNGKPVNEYFTREQDLVEIYAPLRATGHEGTFDITVVVRGGGVTGQAGAVKHGIARALLKYDENLRPVLRRGGFLTRDPRMKERKKPGLKRARKAPTYTKR
ncbi:MAG: 30S ribosomal protein S9 [Ardenticatenia bacterium]|uniref:Small ribosomal subunit protein uS9 n=1 Tax=Ardenticatena maritima TaxID=872965 RepID=A0A0M8K6N3_9CHLR|nr:30S ribosomal protein S9 [Ardenticatena maritima]KPL90054.1 30S ribosomal protein S9 [Ardenticatena maritima]RME11746.1 MAG: 30S ribosomal protein S9 [Ardenticatenia bacterium]GAP61881.1 small subunit ribosomal protein S9 [Ardenticatena maritima]